MRELDRVAAPESDGIALSSQEPHGAIAQDIDGGDNFELTC